MIGMLLIASAVFASSIVSADYQYTTRWHYNGNPVTNVRAVNYVCTSNNCATLGTELSDANSGSSSSITVNYPLPVLNSHGYATYWMAPGYRMQEMGWIPTASGSSTEDFNFEKYASCSAPVNSVTANAAVNEGQALAVTVSVHSSQHEANEIPYAEPSDADIVRDYLSARTNVTITIRNASNAVVYTASSDNYIREDTNLNFAFSWTPNYAQAGSYTITATTNVIDSKCSSATQVTSTPRALTVNDAPNPDNHAPVLAAIGNKNVNNNTLLQFTVSATDPDGDALTYAASPLPLPSGASFNPATKTFSWTPTFAQIGTYNINFSVSDGSLVDYEIVQITVTNNYNNDTEGPDYIYHNQVHYRYNGHIWHWFEIIWVDPSGVDSSWINFDGTMYHALLTDNYDMYDWMDNGTQFFICARDVYIWQNNTLACMLGIPDLAEANYTYDWYANDTFGNTAHVGPLSYDFHMVDDVPQYSNLIETPTDPATYALGKVYTFNITWTDYDMFWGDGLEFDGQDYSGYYTGEYMSQLEINSILNDEGHIRLVYNDTGSVRTSVFMIKNLGVGVHNYTWSAWDTLGNSNHTNLLTYTVNAQNHDDDDDDDQQENDDDSHEQNTITISDSELANGISLWMLIGEKIKFEYCGAPYYIKLKDIENNKAIFTMTPDVVSQFSLGKSESKKIDLDGDGVDDITFKVEDLTTTKAKVYIKRLGAEVCKSAPSAPITYATESDDSVLLNPKSEGVFDTMKYLPWILAAGVLILMILAILVAALGRKRKRVAVQIKR